MPMVEERAGELSTDRDARPAAGPVPEHRGLVHPIERCRRPAARRAGGRIRRTLRAHVDRHAKAGAAKLLAIEPKIERRLCQLAPHSALHHQIPQADATPQGPMGRGAAPYRRRPGCRSLPRRGLRVDRGHVPGRIADDQHGRGPHHRARRLVRRCERRRHLGDRLAGTHHLEAGPFAHPLLRAGAEIHQVAAQVADRGPRVGGGGCGARLCPCPSGHRDRHQRHCAQQRRDRLAAVHELPRGWQE